VSSDTLFLHVLGSARTGLIFTGQLSGLTPPGQTEPGIPYHVPSCWVPVGGSGAVGTHSWLGSAGGGGSGERLCGSCGLFCVFSSSVSLLLLFPLFAVLLNCPHPDPPVSACFFSFSPAPRRGDRRPRGAFVAGRSQTITLQIQCWITTTKDRLQICHCRKRGEKELELQKEQLFFQSSE